MKHPEVEGGTNGIHNFYFDCGYISNCNFKGYIISAPFMGMSLF